MLAVAAATAATAWTAIQARDDLVAASESATALRTALTDGDQELATAELENVQAHAAAAADTTSSTPWRILKRIPVVGDDATAVQAVATTISALSQDALPPIVDAVGSLDAGSFAPRNGRLPVDDIEQLQDPVAQASEAFARADAQLAEVDTEGLTETVASRYDELTDQVADATATLDATRRAVDVLPAMLGADGERRYLLLFQNNAEIRATGGIPGAMSVLEARNGRLAMVEQLSAADFPVPDEPILPLTSEERALFGEQLGIYVQDANFTPDFPRTSMLSAAHYDNRPDSEDPLDGVLSVDPVAMSYLLEVTGPITVDGIELTADNAVAELLNNTYLRLEDPDAQNEFFRDVARETFERVLAGSKDPQALIRALARGVDERRLLVTSFDGGEQAILRGTPVAGELPVDSTERPQVAVSFNDATATKLSYYLDYDVEVVADSCADGVQQLTGTLRMLSDAPEDAEGLPESVTGPGLYDVPRGTQIVVVDLFGPAAGELTKVRIDGKPAGEKHHQFAGRPVAQVPLFFESGDTTEVTWTMTTGEGQTGPADVWVTPGVAPEPEWSVAPPAC